MNPPDLLNAADIFWAAVFVGVVALALFVYGGVTEWRSENPFQRDWAAVPFTIGTGLVIFDAVLWLIYVVLTS